MKRRKLKIVTVCTVLAAGLMMASCGIGDMVNEIVSEVVEGATGLAFEEMGGGDVYSLGVVNGWQGDVLVTLANNAVSIQFHAHDEVRIEYSAPSRGRYVVPDFSIVSGRVEITEPIGNTSFGTDDRPGVVYVYLPESVVVGNMDLRAANGAVRIIGNDARMADAIEISVTNGIVDLQSLSADEVLATTVNGTISGGAITAETVELRTTNGVITLRNSEVFGNLVARTINGGVTIENVDADMDRADLNAVNGAVTVR